MLQATSAVCFENNYLIHPNSILDADRVLINCMA